MGYVDDAIRQILGGDNAPERFIPYNYSSNGAESRCRVTTGAAYLFGLTVTNANAAARFIQVFDADTFPANGVVPTACFGIAATSNIGVSYFPPRRMDRGIIVAASTTQNTLTLAGADHVFDVQYV